MVQNRIQEFSEKGTQAAQGESESERGRTYTLYLEPRREEIVQYTGGEVARGSMEYFFGHVLPPVRPGFNIDHIMEYCIKSNILCRNNRAKSYSWRCFPIRHSLRKVHHSYVCKTPITKLFDTITKAALGNAGDPDLKATCYAHANENRSTWSMKGSEITPDAHLFLFSPNDTYPKKYEGKHWYNAAFSFHFKRFTDSIFEEDQNAEHYDEYQNSEQILHNLHYCMSVDPCRRFTLGATIEGRRMRLWFYCRSIIICSVAFDFDSEPRTLIKVVLSLVFADKVDLGWDPTVTSNYIGGERVFDFVVAGEHFRTSSTNVVSDSRANDIYTSATRIYKAFTEDDKEEKMPVVIKDYWPTGDLETEDVIQRNILEDINDKEDRELVKSMTLTPIASGRVRVGDREDHTEKTILRGKRPIDRYRILPNSIFKGISSSFYGIEDRRDEVDKPFRGLASQLMMGRRIYNHRWHYRIIFKEYAVPYNKLRNLDDMLLVLVCAVKVLRVIHKAGWVHRDLSTGNLYLYTDPVTGEKRGLVGDLEFAKRAGTGDKSDDELGTPDFMASEISNKAYQFGFIEHTYITHIPDNFDDLDFDTYEGLAADTDSIGVWANYIHDLESIWWIVVWTLFSYQDASAVASKSKEYKVTRKYQEYSRAVLFSGYTSITQRYAFLSSPPHFHKHIRRAPDSFEGLKTIAIYVRKYLIESYGKEESKRVEPILLSDEGSLHSKILSVLDKVPRHNIIVETIDKERKKEVEETRSKRETYDNRDDDGQPGKRLKPMQESNKMNLDSSIGSSDQAVTKESNPGANRMVLRSGLRSRQNKSNKGSRGRSPIITSGAKRPMKGRVPEIIVPSIRDIDRRPRVIDKKLSLTSGVKIGQKKLNNKNLNRNRKTSVRARKLKGKALVLDGNRRITRSMARMMLPALVTANGTQASSLKSKVASTKSRKFQ